MGEVVPGLGYGSAIRGNPAFSLEDLKRASHTAAIAGKEKLASQC